jgi:hypothetical protein
MIRVPIADNSNNLSSSPKRLNQIWVPLNRLFNGFRGLKWPDCEGNHSQLRSVVDKNEWDKSDHSPIYRHGMQRENFVSQQLNQQIHFI